MQVCISTAGRRASLAPRDGRSPAAPKGCVGIDLKKLVISSACTEKLQRKYSGHADFLDASCSLGGSSSGLSERIMIFGLDDLVLICSTGVGFTWPFPREDSSVQYVCSLCRCPERTSGRIPLCRVVTENDGLQDDRRLGFAIIGTGC